MTKRIKFFIIVLISVCVVFFIKPVMAEEVLTKKMEFMIEFKSNMDKEYNEISFDPYIYNNFENFIIEDDKGKIIPYFIKNIENQIKADETKRLYKLYFEIIDYHEDDLYYYRDFEIIKEDKNKDEYINEINILSDEDFYKNITILGSMDKINWESIASGSLYDIKSNDKANGTVLYFEPVFYKYYRLKVEGVEKIIPFEIYSYAIDKKSIDEDNYIVTTTEIFNKTLNANFTTKELVSEDSNIKKSQTKITISGLKTDLPTTMKNINIKSIEFDVQDDNFDRDVLFTGENVEEYLDYFYNDDFIKKVNLGNESDNNLKLNLDYTNIEDVFYIIVNNEFDEQLKINNIKTTYYYEKIIFKGSDTNKYFLKSINNIREKPFYDIRQLENIIIADDRNIIDSYNIINVENVFEVEKDYTFIYNSFFVVVSVVLVVILINSFKKFKTE